MKKTVSLKAAEIGNDLRSWITHRTYVDTAFAADVERHDGYLLTVSFHPALAHEKGRVIKDVVYPMIYDCMPTCWNAVNEVVLGKRNFYSHGSKKDRCGRGIMCIESKAHDGASFAGPHLHGVFFVHQKRPHSAPKIVSQTKAKLIRIFRKKWPTMNVNIKPIAGAAGRKRALQYITKERETVANSVIREGAF